MKPGYTVYFTCGRNPNGYHGTVTSLTTDEQGRPAAWVRVAGFPAWVHLQALDELVRTCGVCPDCRRRSDERPDCRRHALQLEHAV